MLMRRIAGCTVSVSAGMSRSTSPGMLSPRQLLGGKAAQGDDYETILLHDKDDLKQEEQPEPDDLSQQDDASAQEPSPRPRLQSLQRTLRHEQDEPDSSGVRKAGVLSTFVSGVLDDLSPFALYFGIGQNESHEKNIVLGGFLAGVSAVLALLFRAYRFHFKKDMRIHPKVYPTCMSFMWIINAIFVVAAPLQVARRYTMVVFMVGIFLANILALAARRPLFLEVAMEAGPCLESHHKEYKRMYWIMSIAMAIVAAVQTGSIIAGTVGPYAKPQYIDVTHILVPLGLLALAATSLPTYAWYQRKRMRHELELAIDRSPKVFGMELSAV